MNFKHLTDKELLITAKNRATTIREQTLILIEILSEINERKLFADLAYATLFQYIVEELKFSESQAAVYNNIVKAKIMELSQNLIRTGELTLQNAGFAAQVIKENKVEGADKKVEIIHSFKLLSKDQAQLRVRELTGKHEPNYTLEKIKITKVLKAKIEQFKKRLNLPANMELTEILELLLDQQQNNTIQENKSITPKTKTTLVTKVNHQCEYVSENGSRCQATKYLEIDHIEPKALGGSNHPVNLRVYCRNHNLRAAIQTLGQHSINKRQKNKSTNFSFL